VWHVRSWVCDVLASGRKSTFFGEDVSRRRNEQGSSLQLKSVEELLRRCEKPASGPLEQGPQLEADCWWSTAPRFYQKRGESAGADPSHRLDDSECDALVLEDFQD
jgi:hypothetical protein